MDNDQTKGIYPPNDINPRDKDIKWGIKYAKAAWSDWNYTVPRTCFYNSADKYEELRLYAQGKQPINKYKKLKAVDEQTDNTWLVVDWSVRPVIPKFRDIALSRLMQQQYNIVATPVDPQAKGELEQIYADIKAKIAIRQLLQQQNPELANHPMVQPQPGDPMDFEELQMRNEFGEQFNRSKDAEQVIQLMFYENDVEQMRRRWDESFFDCGPAGYKAWLDHNGRPKCRDVNPEAVITNYCRFPDFRDLLHAGEVIDVSLVDLATMKDDNGQPYFTPEQIEIMKETAAGKWSNPTMVGRSSNYYKNYDSRSVKVLDLQFYSYNELNFERNVNRRGNAMFNEVDWDRRNNKKDKYLRKKIKVVYEIKWVVGTDYAYDFRLKKDMKRTVNPKHMAETTLDYKFFAPNFYEMRTLSMMERLVPLADEYQMTVYQIQNFINRMVPNGWWIDLDALENVALNKGGENMKPVDLLQMFFESGVLVGRSKDVMGDNVNYKPIIPIDNNAYNQLQALYEHLQLLLMQMQSIIGLNELTDGSTPNPKMLNGVASIAVQSTNNSLFQIQFGERHLLKSLAEDMLMLAKQAIKRGNVEGFAKALSSNTLEFIKASDDLPLRDHGIMLDEMPTDDQKQLLLMQIQQDQALGLLDSADALYILNVYNIKQAQQMLAYKVRKNKEAQQRAEMAKIQENNQGAQQAAIVAEQAKQQTLQLEWQLKTQYMMQEKEMEMQIKQQEMQLKYGMNTENNETKIATTVLQNESKEHIAENAEPAAK